jgi:hypothetical protein
MPITGTMARKMSPTSTTGSSRVIGQPAGFAGASRDMACGPFIGRGPEPVSSSTIAAISVAVAAGHRGGAARQKSGDRPVIV